MRHQHTARRPEDAAHQRSRGASVERRSRRDVGGGTPIHPQSGPGELNLLNAFVLRTL
jgi:hypothetical protein